MAVVLELHYPENPVVKYICARVGLAALAALTIMLLASMALPVSAARHDNAPVVEVNGTVTVIHIDEFDRNKSRTVFFLDEDDSGEMLELKFEGKPPKSLRTGAKVRIRGRAVGKELWVNEIAQADRQGAGTGDDVTVAGAVTAGQRRALLMVVNMSNSPGYYGATTADAGAGVLFTDSYSLNTVYDEGSFGRLSYPGDRASDVVILEIPYSPNCPIWTIARDADAAAVNAGVDLSLYHNKIYLVPPKSISDCAWLALGEVGPYGGTATRRSWSVYNNAVIYVHEVGHNLGWLHASTDLDNDGVVDSEYGDLSDAMGFCCYQRKFNGVHLDQIGWLNTVSGMVTTVTADGVFDIARLGSDPAVNAAPQVIKVERPDTGDYYYLSYRQTAGLDLAMWSQYTAGVNIHHGLSAGRKSFFIDALADGEIFVDLKLGLTVRQIAKDADTVTVDISFDKCTRSAPLLAVGPSPQVVPDNGPFQAAYGVSVTNNDSALCGPSSFDLISDLDIFTGTLTPNVLDVAPGETATAVLTVDVDNASDGPYTLWMTANDPGGTHAEVSASAILQVDSVAPLAPGGLVVSKDRYRGTVLAVLGWEAAVDVAPGSGIAAYRVYRDGVFLAEVTGLGYTDRTVGRKGSYVYTITAIDHADHESQPSGAVSFPPPRAKGNKKTS